MMKINKNAKISLVGNVESFIFPANKIKSYNDYLLLGGSPAFPTYRSIIAQSISIQYEKKDNLVVDAGMQRTIDLWIGDVTGKWTHCGVGSGTTGAASGDTDLETAIGREAITDDYRSGLEAHFDTFFSTSAQNGTWEETGIFSASSGGTMLCRKTFASTFTKSTSNTALIAWTVTLAAI